VPALQRTSRARSCIRSTRSSSNYPHHAAALFRFVTADRDEMIPTEHGSLLNSDWGGPSLQVTFRGGHNSPRPPHIYDAAGTFLRAVLESSDKGSAGEAEAVKAAFASIQSLCEDTPGDLPPGWLSATDPETGDTYYYDTFTHKTTWFRPYKPSEGYKKSDDEPTKSSKGPSSAGEGGSAAARRDGGEFGAFSGFGSPGVEDDAGGKGGAAEVLSVAEVDEDDLSPADLEQLIKSAANPAAKGQQPPVPTGAVRHSNCKLYSQHVRGPAVRVNLDTSTVSPHSRCYVCAVFLGHQ